MKKTATALTLTDFERDRGFPRTTTISVSTGVADTFFLEIVTRFEEDDSSETTTRLTQREMIALGRTLLETAGATNISHSYIPLAEEE